VTDGRIELPRREAASLDVPQHLAARRLGAQARGEVGRITDRRVIPASLEADRAARRVALRDADAEREALARLIHEIGALAPLIETAESQASPDARIRFRYDWLRQDLERIRAVRAGAAKSTIIVDANEGWTPDSYAELAPELLRLGVALVEQPLPAWDDGALKDMARPLPVCADEACHDTASLAQMAGKYDMINIKLDKTGGLTHGLELARAARKLGLGVMVGCMGGTSLSMAPSHVVAQLCDFVDIDGPLLIRNDRPGGLVYERGQVTLPARPFWGQPERDRN